MKAIFDWEMVQTPTFSLLINIRRFVPPIGDLEWAVSIYNYDNKFYVYLHGTVGTVATIPINEHMFNSLNEAKSFADNVIKEQGYKTIPLDYKVLL